MRATKLIREKKHLSYFDRLKYLNLRTLQYRRFGGDIMVFKLLSGVHDSNIACQFFIKVIIFVYLKVMFIMIYEYITLATVSYLSGIVCLTMLLTLNLFVFLKKTWIISGLIKIAIMTINPT